MVARWKRGMETRRKKMKELRSIWKIVKNIVIPMYNVGWVLDLSGGSLHTFYKSLTTILYT